MIPVKQLAVTIGLFFLLILIQLQENTVATCSLRVGYPRAVLNYSVGDSLTLNCTILFCGDVPKIYWCKLQTNNCQPLIGSIHHQLKTYSPNDTEKVLHTVYTIPTVTLADSGIFRCQATQGDSHGMGHTIIVNVFENKDATCSLFVLYPKPVLNYSEGDSLTLNCTVQFCANGAQLPEAHWCKMHGKTCQPVTGRLHYPNMTYSPQYTEKKMLVIHAVSHVDLSNSGVYQCQATHGAVTAVGQFVSVNVGKISPAHSLWRWYSICRWIIFGLLALIPISLCILLYG
ncbi:uncharacterized protein [Heterodontus francisci]|uniref:uncharacterized protein n=1 Tax=Heterodontus francisci TaxID=7792 RepID=UPI00355C98D2